MGQILAKSPHPAAPKPDRETDATFDPLYGFSNGRKPRVMIATEDEMEAAKLPLDQRDYCAHLLIKYHSCRRDVWPLAVKCKHERHAVEQCQYQDYIMRMKEYERERRLLARKRRKELKNGGLENIE